MPTTVAAVRQRVATTILPLRHVLQANVMEHAIPVLPTGACPSPAVRKDRARAIGPLPLMLKPPPRHPATTTSSPMDARSTSTPMPTTVADVAWLAAAITFPHHYAAVECAMAHAMPVSLTGMCGDVIERSLEPELERERE